MYLLGAFVSLLIADTKVPNHEPVIKINKILIKNLRRWLLASVKKSNNKNRSPIASGNTALDTDISCNIKYDIWFLAVVVQKVLPMREHMLHSSKLAYYHL